jgi:hypothetical protein
MDEKPKKAPNGQGSPGALLPSGQPNLKQYGIPTADQFMGNAQKQPTRARTVREIYRDLVGQGIHPKEAAKAAQAQTGHSVVTGEVIKHQLKFSKKSGKIIGQFGTSSGKASSGRFGQYGR